MSDDLDIYYLNAGQTARGLQVVTYQRPRCPHCGSEKITTRRSFPQGDGSMFRYTRCKECGENFAVVAE